MSERTISNNEQLSPWQKNPNKFSTSKVLTISLGFFATSIAWSIYNSNVNVAFYALIPNYLVVGFLMTMDNIIGIFMQPFTGALSDRTKSRWGRRMPYIIIGIPVSAILFILIPLVQTKLVPLLIAVFFFNVSMSFWRAPVVAMMPDWVAPKDRSKGNGIVNFLGGVGSVAGFAVGGLLISRSVFLGFAFVSIVMIISVIIMIFAIKEPDTRNWQFIDERTKKQVGIFDSIKLILRDKEKSPLYMLLAIFCWFLAYQGLESLWTVYAENYFGLTQGQATFSLTYVALPFMLFAIPAGYIAKRFTRKRTILTGLIIGTVVIFIANFIKGKPNAIYMYIIFVIFGIGWAMVNINSIAMIWQMAPSAKHIGTYTGLYYFFSFLAAIIGPTVIGFFTQYVVGRQNMFIICTGFLIAAIIFMLLVKRGEAVLTAEEEAAKQKAIQEVERD